MHNILIWDILDTYLRRDLTNRGDVNLKSAIFD